MHPGYHFLILISCSGENMTNCILAVDVGSSAAKVGLLNESGQVLAVGSYPYPTAEPLRGYKEQDPHDWWNAVRAGIRHVLSVVPDASVLAVGVTGYICSLTFVGSRGTPVRRSIGFQDQRASEEVIELYNTFSRSELAGMLGIDLPPSATWPLPRLLWIKKHEIDVLNRTRYLLQAKDYINLKLTGNVGSDPSSNRGLIDFATNGAATGILTKLNLPDLLPPIFQPDQFIGEVTPKAALETGLASGVPVVAGWNDLNASVLGSGLVRKDDVFDVTGTSEHIGIITDNWYSTDHLMCAPYLPGRNLFYGVIYNGGGSLQWFKRFLNKPMDAVVASFAHSSNELLFLPYLEGERSPIWDPHASGALLGLRTVHGQGDVTRAILEGVAFSLRQNLESIERHLPVAATTLVASGGASTILPWNQIKADVLNMNVATLRNPHAGMQGAAILAAVAVKLYPNVETAAATMANTAGVFSPQAANRGHANRMYAIYNEVYPALRKILHRLSSEGLTRQEQGDCMNEKKAVVFGAGKIARGFIGHLLTLSGYHITFVEKNPDMVRSLRERGLYTIEIMGAPEKSTTITGFDVLQSDEAAAVVRAIEEASVIFVSIGGPNLPQIAPLLAAGLETRQADLNIILGENYFQPAQWLRQLVAEHLPALRREWFEKHVGIVETMILRSTIEPTAEMKAEDPLSLKAQNAWEIPADKEAFVGEIPAVQGLVPRGDFQGGLIRKLYTYNCINAVIAYTGYLKGYKLLSDAARDSEILLLARAAYAESSDALCKRYGFNREEQYEFAEAAIMKYQNQEIVDPIERNVRDPLRKLARNDRLVGPACLAIEYGKRPVALSLAIAAAFMYDYPEDPSSVILQRLIAEKGLAATVGEVCGLDQGSELSGLIVESYYEYENRVSDRTLGRMV
jgi:sugar (pentulose or hexulose) kinase/mannitol-1-phosphate/altronate dehydrogenase